MPMTFEDQALGANDALKGFEKADDLAKAYLDLHGKVSSGSVELIPEDIRKDPSLSAFKTVGDIAKSYVETKKLVGAIKRPPADVTGYKFTNVDGLDPAVKADANFQKFIAEGALKEGMTAEDADRAHRFAMLYTNQLILKQKETQAANFQKADAALHQKWGADYEKNFKRVTDTLTKAGGEEIGKKMGAVLQSSPEALDTLAKVFNLLSEDSIGTLGGTPGGDGSTEADEKEFQALSEIVAGRGDQKHPLANVQDPKHMEAVARWTELNRKHFSK